MKNTIAALATPPGVSSIAVIRLSGPESIIITDKIFNGKIKLIDARSHTIHYGSIIQDSAIIDDVTVSIFKSPNSYTGEDVIEISCHGNMIIVNQILNALIQNGANMAMPGEFTKRAFLNGKIDLSQAEAIADIIHSQTHPGLITSERQLAGGFKNRIIELRKKLLDISSLLELELDFSDEDFEFINKDDIIKMIKSTINYTKSLSNSYNTAQILRSGFFLAIAGYPNSGKSTLFNKLLQKSRAIVSHLPGTTRDYIEESVIINNIPIRIIDTAGFRDTDDSIEIAGIKMANSVMNQANMIIVVNDITISPNHSDKLFNILKNNYTQADVILVQNKIDLIKEFDELQIIPYHISAKKDIGIEDIKNLITEKTQFNEDAVNDILINQRQYLLLQTSTTYLENALSSTKNNLPNEIISIDIKEAAKTFGELTGENWNEDVLNNIFSRFCIGK